MNYWLLKSDPEEFGYDDLARVKQTVWDGVTNNLALQHLRQIRKGDLLLIYHTGDEKAVVGLAVAVSNPYPDPKFDTEKLAVLEIKAKKRAGRPLALAEIKAMAEFADFALVKMPRLSVMPVSEQVYTRLARLAELA